MATGRELPIIGAYGKERFLQFNPEDSANWYIVGDPNGKKQNAMYPAMGRRHINIMGLNKLQFNVEPRQNFRTRNYAYYVVGDKVKQVDANLNVVDISNAAFQTLVGGVWFAVLYTPTLTYVGIADGHKFFVYTEENGTFVEVTDPNLYGSVPNPTYLAVIGNRFAVSSNNSSQYSLSAVNLGAAPLDPATCFTVAGQAVFAQEAGIIRQMAVNQNILYIFTDFTTGIWANIQSTIEDSTGTATQFPLKKNTSFSFPYGIKSPHSLAVNFGLMVWEGNTQDGLVQIVASSGEIPQPISDQSIGVLFQNANTPSGLSPFIEFDSNGFLYQYENTIFYRLSAGQYQNYQILDVNSRASSIEYCFDTKKWHRVIEQNGERNRIQKHIFFANRHLVTVQDDGTVYEFSGRFYDNELRNPDQTDGQASDAYLIKPFRYERVTPIIFEKDYSEFETPWVQIDFVFGDRTFVRTDAPFENAEFLVDEDGETFLIDEEGENGNDVYLIGEGSSTPVPSSAHYFNLFKPSVELFFSDDGGITYQTADVREFSDLGVYSWRMRWYQLGCSRNRVYKLIVVSPAPIVILGAWHLVKRVSGGAA